MRGLAGWLEGQGLKTLAGNNELLYKRWQVCGVGTNAVPYHAGQQPSIALVAKSTCSPTMRVFNTNQTVATSSSQYILVMLLTLCRTFDGALASHQVYCTVVIVLYCTAPYHRLTVICMPFMPCVQERLSLAVVDDGEQLGPLSPQVREGDRGITAAWGRLHGTKVGDVGALGQHTEWAGCVGLDVLACSHCHPTHTERQGVGTV